MPGPFDPCQYPGQHALGDCGYCDDYHAKLAVIRLILERPRIVVLIPDEVTA